MASNGKTINLGTSNYTGARNTCSNGSSSYTGARNTNRGTSNYKNAEPKSGGKDRNVAFRVQTSVNKPWKHTNRGF